MIDVYNKYKFHKKVYEKIKMGEETREKIINYMVTHFKNGKIYFKTKEMANDLNINKASVAMHLKFMYENQELLPFYIHKWGVSKGITWQLTKVVTWY